MAKLTTKMNAKIRKRSDPVVARRFVTIGVLVSAVMVGVSLFVTVYFDPEKVAQRKFEELATTYYEDYYYDKFMSEIDPELKEKKLEVFEQTGFQPVLLRQLLLYQNGKYASYKGYFERDGFSCDKNKTSAKFYPVAPYGKTDYTVKYEYSCAKE
ncbi:hypothetical protein IKL45_03750 [Candidatus Saccharibacteria bacterium]|nr:hypothetical protein [Candidatus Saccharibacteria bacterium]MBR6122232.1 hypothetical protein [Candidatus Saccharibacteria bacterium]